MREQQELNPKYTIADGAKGLRAGQAAAWPRIPCHGDVFHIQYQCTRLAFFLERRATGAMTRRQKLETQMEKANGTLIIFPLKKNGKIFLLDRFSL